MNIYKKLVTLIGCFLLITAQPMQAHKAQLVGGIAGCTISAVVMAYSFLQAKPSLDALMIMFFRNRRAVAPQPDTERQPSILEQDFLPQNNASTQGATLYTVFAKDLIAPCLGFAAGTTCLAFFIKMIIAAKK
jgi:hypothetical protein